MDALKHYTHPATTLKYFETFVENSRKHRKATIKAGDKLKMRATDSISGVYFETESGKGSFEYSYDLELKAYFRERIRVFDAIATEWYYDYRHFI